jgi:Fibronectin type III domain
MRVSPSVPSFVLGLSIMLLVGCAGDEGTMGTTATLSWDPGEGHEGDTYTVHYGKDSSGFPGSCNYEHAVDVLGSSVILTGLEPNTHYYFAVSAFNGERSLCSNEVSKLTPEMELQIGDAPVKVEESQGEPAGRPQELFIGENRVKL